MNRTFKFGLLTALVVIFGLAHSLSASSSHHHKKRSSVRSIVKHINNTTEQILQTVNTINQTTTQDLATDLEILDVVNDINGIVSCGAPNQITQDMVTAGLTITESGAYEFCGNIVFSPTAPASTAFNSVDQPDFEKMKADIRQVIQDKKGHVRFSDVKKVTDSYTPSLDLSTLASASSGPFSFAAITIATNDVYIDMNNFVLEQGNGTPGVIGFYLAPGIQNVTIANGTVRSFLVGVGSWIATAVSPSPQQYIDTLVFDNLNLLENGGANGDPSQGTSYPYNNMAYGVGGLILATDLLTLGNIGADSPPNYIEPFYTNVTVRNCRVNNNTMFGLGFTQVGNLLIENTQCDGTYIGDAPLGYLPFGGSGIVGLTLQSCQNVEIYHSSFNGSTFQGTSADTYIVAISGAGMFVSRNIILKDSQFNNTYGEGLFVTGVVANLPSGVLAENCQFNNITSVGVIVGFQMGWHSSDTHETAPLVSGDGIRVVGCQFNQITCNATSSPQVNGVNFITNKDVTFENCQAIGLSNTQSSTNEVCGFDIDSSPEVNKSLEILTLRNIRWKNCTVGDISAVSGYVAGIKAGSYTSSGTTPPNGVFQNVGIEDCTISHLRTGTSTDGVDGILIFSDPSPTIFTNSFLENNRISDIYSTVSSALPTGIHVSNVQRPNLTGNSVSDCTNGIIFDEGTVQGTVRGNEVDNCPKAGIVDTLTPTKSTYIQNVVITCGTPSTDATNYDIDWGITPPIDHGSLSGGYPATSNVWHNLSIVP